MGVTPFYKRFAHDGVTGPNMATVYSDRGQGVRAPVVFYNRSQRGGGAAEARRLRLERDLRAAACAGSTAAASSPRFPRPRRELIIEGDEGGQGGRRGRLLRSELPREAVEDLGGGAAQPSK